MIQTITVPDTGETYTRKDVHEAAKLLPARCRSTFIDLWEQADAMDLYDGELHQYLGVILDRWKRDKKYLERYQDIIQRHQDDLQNFHTENLAGRF